MNQSIGATSVSITVEVYDDSGLPVTGLTAATFPVVYWRLGNGAPNNLTNPINDLSSIVGPWVDSGVKESGQGRYRLDLSDFMFASGGIVSVWAEETGKRMMPLLLEVGLANKDIPSATAGLLTAQTMTFTTTYIEGVMNLYQGVEYSVANGNSTPFHFTNLPDLTAGSAKVHILPSKGAAIIDQALTITNPGTATQTITFTMTAANTDKLDPPHSYLATILYKTATASDYSVAVEFPVATRRA